MKRLEGLKLGSFSPLRVKELDQLYKLEEIKPAEPYLFDLLQNNKVLIMIDELDRGWDASEDARQFVAGLFQACVALNGVHKNFRVIVSLRRELYDNIPEMDEDAQKVRDLMKYVAWDEDGLRRLVAARIKRLMFLPDGYDASFYWNQIFAETLEYRQAKSFNYIVDRTLYRPREIIGFCNACLEHAEPDVERIDYGVVSRAEAVYSKDRAQDIAAEYRFQYPGLTEVFETFLGSVHNFTRQQLELHCMKSILREVRCPNAESWMSNRSEIELIEILWQIGFLRALLRGGQKGIVRSGSRYAGPHQVSTLNLHDVSQFHVHQMFRAHLNMKEK